MLRVDWKEFDCSVMEEIKPLERGVGNPAGTTNRPDYLPVIATFDTETSTIMINGKEHAFVYVWMFYLEHLDTMITGRTIEEYIDFAREISAHMNGTMLTYCHNYSFDWQFQTGKYKFIDADDMPEVFAVKPRKILYATMFKLEHRCSMLLSNLSLNSYTKEMRVEHRKLSGAEFDYSKVRYPWTVIGDKPERGKQHSEWEYCTNDVVGLAEAVKKEIELSGKDLYHFPLTSTGFVRQDLRQAVRHISGNLFKSLQPDYALYKLLRRAFRGGDTHANRIIAGEVQPAGYSYDRSSSYPDVLCNHMYPMSPFKKCEKLDFESIWERHKIYRRALILRVVFVNIRLRYENWGFPYIPADKDHSDLPKKKPVLDKNGKHVRDKNGEYLYEDPVLYDNGRVMESPWVRIVITDVDLDIILKEYEWDDMIIEEAYESRYGYLPPSLIDVVRYYYSMKTSLKGDEEQAVFYAKMKARLNAIFGCMAQDIIKFDLEYNANTHDWDEKLYDRKKKQYVDATEEEVYEAKIARAWLPYQFGVWTTCLARRELHRGLWNVMDQGGMPLYCDTDSVKYLGENVKWDKLNESLKESSLKNHAFADDINGVRHYMGVWEKEGHAEHSFERFATLGAKKYGYEELNIKEGTYALKFTIAAVDKRKGAAEMFKYYGWKSLDYFASCRKFHNEFVFREAGGTALIYNDDDDIDLEIDGHKLHIGPNVVIKDDTYRLSLQGDYSALLQPPEFLDFSVD